MFGKRQPQGDYQRNADEKRYRREAGLRAGAGAAVVVAVAGVTRLGDDVGRALIKAGDDVGAALSHHADDVGAAAAATADDVMAQGVRHGDGEIAGRVAEEVVIRGGIEAARRVTDEEEP
jgi:hypothetical protein